MYKTKNVSSKCLFLQTTGRKRKSVAAEDKKSKDNEKEKKEPAEKKKKGADSENLVGFSRNLEPDKILGNNKSIYNISS